RLAHPIVEELASVTSTKTDTQDTEHIQVFRDPRVAIDRSQRLQLGAKEQIDIFIKARFFGAADNPAQAKALRRGVRVRGLYEEAVLSAPEVRPYLRQWTSQGEVARIYKGELPHKLAIFDRQSILLPLITPGGIGRTL